MKAIKPETGIQWICRKNIF